MSQISKNKLKPKVRKEVTKRFINTIADLDKSSAQIFYQKFFTKTEQLMFAKRLTIIYLLREGFTGYRIAKFLKVSKTTVYSLEEQYSTVEREAIVTRCEQYDTHDGLFKELKELLQQGMSLDPKKRSKWLTEFEKKYQ